MGHKASRLAAATVIAVGTSLAALVPSATAHDGATSSDGAIDHAKITHNHHQHGGDHGHLPASKANVDLVSKLALKNVEPEKIADVGVHKGYAYLAAWGGATCKYNGVHVVDIKNPAQPKEVSFIVAKEGSAPGEGIQALSVGTPAFTGDILVTNNEVCKAMTGVGGLNIYDVTDPAHPTPLAVGIGDETVAGAGKKDANEIHSVFAWDAGAKAYAVIVDNEEGPDVDILDITNPKKPKVIAEYDIDEKFPGITQPGLDEIFLHDMVVKEIGGRQVMLLSYWDGGYVQIDVTDPLNISLLADSTFADPDPEAAESGLSVKPEGNAHQAEFTLDNKYVLAADEDFSPYALKTSNLTDGTAISAGQGSGTTKLTPGQELTGVAKFAGLACPGSAAVPAGDPNAVDIAVVERGVCTFTEKVAAVIAAGGYDAVLIFNRTGTDACDAALGMDVQGDIPTFGVAPRGQGFAIFGQPYSNADCLAGTGPAQLPVPLGTAGDTLTFSSYFDGWGYVHLYDRKSMKELDTYAVPEAHDPAYAEDHGDLSVHEVATSAKQADLAYFSYYSAGFRVTRIVNGKIQEVGHFVDEGGNNFWGVQVFEHDGQEYVAASDRDQGLYIFRYTGT
ncbi:LVIVD repeat-containing protein [Nonomuraea polychroma]|uniref:LVIVD repeat-containing protein n=1 Tax=Nonomuraea polychroma TaxID=46176 RepID=A0A438MAL7_9ACTN|nr:PA domain-containing protein [Nonomuraea polychroma]RVX42717.1 LVIVD repeat-containing protein [Nonomuraea polychroma]